MNDYKDTINLPQTDFPMKANLPEREPKMLNFWESSDIYNKLRILRKNKETFILHDGPPYANGDIHLGHVINKVLKDIVVKFKTLSGYDAPFVPGWDCHGLPIEVNVEKKIGRAGDKISISEFKQACRNYAKTQIEVQRKSFKRLGILGDWNNPYITMDYKHEASIIRSFAKVVENGYLERGSKPVYWCIDCGSALAEAEVEYQDKQSIAIDIRFKVVDEESLLERFASGQTFEKTSEIYIPIWTTTPWTIPANQAVALHSDFQYVLVECLIDEKQERLVIVKDLLEDVLSRYGVKSHQVLASCLGKSLEGLLLKHPIYDRNVPVILANHVTIDTGTGAVHTAPGHGEEDFLVGKKYGLPIYNPVDDKGYFLPETPLFGGKHIYESNPLIVDKLRENGMLLHAETITHSYPHCWRHKTPVLFRATPQWFIVMDKFNLRDLVLEEIRKVKFVPEWGKIRLENMVSQRPDWCISRQRAWVVPIPLFVHKDTGELHPNTLELIEEVAKRVEQNGIEVWDELDASELLGSDAKNYIKIKDGLDVWFDSGVTHSCVLTQRDDLRFPADLYLEGSDQYRGWFQSSMIASCAMYGKSPYRQVLTHGFTIDEQGHKMSKSLGNVISPDEINKTLGADVLRLWVAATDYSGDIAASKEIFKHTADIYRRIRNTARFLLSNLYDFDPLANMLSSQNMLSLDKWAVDRARILQEEIQKLYEDYQFHVIVQKIHNFCTIDMGSFYLDIIKDRLYISRKDGIPRRSAQTAMYHILNALVRWIAPILSFTAEEIWKYLEGNYEESVFLTTWYLGCTALDENDSMNQAYWDNIIKIRDAVNKQLEDLRIKGALGSSLEAEVELYADSMMKELLDKLKDELKFVLITSSAIVFDIKNAASDALDSDIKGLKLKITASKHKKCIRCWHQKADVGKNKEHPEICERCVENVEGSGEARQFA